MEIYRYFGDSERINEEMKNYVIVSSCVLNMIKKAQRRETDEVKAEKDDD